MRRGINTTLVAIILLIGIPLSYFGIVYYSINSAELTIANPTLDIGIGDLLTTEGVLNLLLSRQLEGEFDLIIEGRGFVSTTIKSLQAKLYLEDTYIGEIQSDQFYTIPASGTTTAHMSFMIDASDISLSELTSIANSIASHNGEVKMAIIGYYEPILLVFPITLEFSSTSYVYTYSDAPAVTQLIWTSSECEAGEIVDFQVGVKNVFRSGEVNGYLDLFVREDVQYGSDTVADSFRFPVTLSPGQSQSYSDSFTVYKDSDTSGFFLKAQWGSSTIGEQQNSYPPRLSVIEGQLNLENFYWTVEGVTANTCTVGDSVQAHIILRAAQASVQGTVRVMVRKDISIFSDVNYLIRDYSVDLSKGSSKDIVVSFTPDEASGTSLRGFFIELEGDVTWTMSDSYPPRLTVQSSGAPEEPEEPQPDIGYPVVQNTWWLIGGTSVSQCNVGQQVTARVRIQSVTGISSGAVTVRIRKDNALMSDSDHVVKTFTINLGAGQVTDLEVLFTAADKSGFTFRGYFIEVDFTSWETSWTMQSAYPPRLKVN